MAKHRASDKPTSLGAEDWVLTAARAIEEGGISAVAVEPLAKKLGMTKGSFYWHFPNRNSLLQATLERWEQLCTEAVIAAVEGISDPYERIKQLFSEATTEDPLDGTSQGSEIFFSDAFELAVSDAADNSIVGPILNRVAERRIDYLEECYRTLGASAEVARHQAVLAYAAYVGTLRLTREAPSRMPVGDDFHDYRQYMISALVPERLEFESTRRNADPPSDTPGVFRE